MLIHDLSPVLQKKLTRLSLVEKFLKAKALFEVDPRHPSLHVELLEPKHLRIYSFRIDRKYRAQFAIVGGEARILDISLHYQ